LRSSSGKATKFSGNKGTNICINFVDDFGV
jgi:hypothetical protein